MRKLSKIITTNTNQTEKMLLVYEELKKMNKQYFPELTEEELIHQLAVGESQD